MSYQTQFLLALCAYDAVGLCAGGVLLWRLDRGTTAWWRDGVKLIVLEAALFGLALLLARAFSFHKGFAMLRLLAHSVAAVCAPLALVRGIWWLRRGGRAFAALLLGAATAVEGVYLYASQWEITWLEVTRYEVATPRLRMGDRPIRIAVLADLQTDRIGAYEERVFAELDALRADLVLLPGDFLQIIRGTAEEVEEQRLRLAGLFNGLRHVPRYGIAAVFGDVDFDKDLFRGTAVRVVDDAVVRLEGDPPLQLIGLSRWVSREPLAQEHLDAARAFPGPTIVLGHAPDFVSAQVWRHVTTGASGVDVPLLCIAGHTHGGQVVVPGFGPLLTLSSLPRSHASGCHDLGAMTLFVSRGIGHECGLAPRIRFNCRPELALISLVPAARADPKQPHRD